MGLCCYILLYSYWQYGLVEVRFVSWNLVSINKWWLFVYYGKRDSKVTKSLWCGVVKLILIALVCESSLRNMTKIFFFPEFDEKYSIQNSLFSIQHVGLRFTLPRRNHFWHCLIQFLVYTTSCTNNNTPNKSTASIPTDILTLTCMIMLRYDGVYY